MSASVGRLSDNVQRILGAAVTSYTGSNTLGKTAPIVSTEPLALTALPVDVKQKLARSYASAFTQSWSIPKTAAYLSAGEIRFLETHSIDQICTAFDGNGSNLILNFCKQVLQATVTQAICSAIQEVGSKPKGDSPSDATEKPKTISEKEHNRQPAGKEIDKSSVKGVASKIEQLSLKDPHSTVEAGSSKGNPEIDHMKKAAGSAIKSRIQKAVTGQIKSHTEALGEEAALDRAYTALGKGHSMQEAAQICHDAKEANIAFIKHAGKTIATAAATGKFLSMVEESGWQAAAAETVKTATISFVTKYTAKTVTTFVGCTNPVWCASTVATILSDAFIPQDTAPAYHDMYPPMQPPHISEVTESRLPTMQPDGPRLHQ